MGLVPELASSFYIAARTGFGQANRLMLTGETILAERALAIGLIDETVEDLGALMPELKTWPKRWAITPASPPHG